MQLCYVHTWTSLRLTLDLLRPDSHAICLPNHFHSIHPIFHISQLELVELDPFLQHAQPLSPPVEINGDIEYEVSKILNSKLDRCFQGNGLLCYLVWWTGYEGMEEETSWISTQDLEHAQEVIQVFHHHYLSGCIVSVGWSLPNTNIHH